MSFITRAFTPPGAGSNPPGSPANPLPTAAAIPPPAPVPTPPPAPTLPTAPPPPTPFSFTATQAPAARRAALTGTSILGAAATTGQTAQAVATGGQKRATLG